MTFPVAKAGHPLILGGAFVTLVFALLGMPYPALMGLVITLCICGFSGIRIGLFPTSRRPSFLPPTER